MAKAAKEEDRFRIMLEDAVKEILRSPEATPAEKLKAVEQGCHLLQLRLKYSGTPESFFPSGSGA